MGLELELEPQRSVRGGNDVMMFGRVDRDEFRALGPESIFVCSSSFAASSEEGFCTHQAVHRQHEMLTRLLGNVLSGSSIWNKSRFLRFIGRTLYIFCTLDILFNSLFWLDSCEGPASTITQITQTTRVNPIRLPESVLLASWNGHDPLLFSKD